MGGRIFGVSRTFPSRPRTRRRPRPRILAADDGSVGPRNGFLYWPPRIRQTDPEKIYRTNPEGMKGLSLGF